MRAQAGRAEALDIGISPETVCYIVHKAREFDAKVAPSGLEPDR